MPRQDDDRATTWVLAEPNRTWTLGPYATISTDGETGILDTAEGSQIRILGSVLGDGAEIGVKMGSGTSSVSIGRSGAIEDVEIGISMDPGGGIVENSGLIHGYESGIEGERGVVRNGGDIHGRIGVFFTVGGFVIENDGVIEGSFVGVGTFGPGGTIRNEADGEIRGEIAIVLEGAGMTSIVNDGVLRGYGTAIQCEADARVEVVNRGAIIGDVLLSALNDRVDTRGGTVRGVIYGGNGDDVYLVSDSSIKIWDIGSSFFDTVRSSASYTITGGMDHLYLTGKADINGFGNGGNNQIFGNSGRNVLSGDAGADQLTGKKGNDQLSGGAGADLFLFHRGDGHDQIADFEEIDVLSSNLVRNARDFERLDVRQVGDDVIIDFGQGDKLTLWDFDRADLDFSDFVRAV